jgi:hypothetical protein
VEPVSFRNAHSGYETIARLADDDEEQDLVVCPRERELLTTLEAREAMPDCTGGDCAKRASRRG